LRSLIDPVAESILELFKLLQRFFDAGLFEAGATLRELCQSHLVCLDNLEQRIVHAGDGVGKNSFNVALVPKARVHTLCHVADHVVDLAEA
jgi:hypothetical protein